MWRYPAANINVKPDPAGNGLWELFNNDGTFTAGSVDGPIQVMLINAALTGGADATFDITPTTIYDFTSY